MIGEIRKEMSDLAITRKALRDFGLLFCVVFCAGAGVLLWQSRPHWQWPAAAGLVFLAAGVFSPMTLRLPYRAWMFLAALMGWFMTRLLLAASFFLIMTPLGLLLRALGKDLLDEKIQKEAATYWKKHDGVNDMSRYKKQF